MIPALGQAVVPHWAEEARHAEGPSEAMTLDSFSALSW